MPVKGIINAQRVEQCVRNMLIGDIGYILLEDIELTTRGILLNTRSRVHSPDELREDEKLVEDDDALSDQTQFYARITRLKHGLTEHNFELDFSHLKYEESVLTVYSAVRYSNLVSESEYETEWIVFTDMHYEFGILDPEPEGVELLEKQLREATEQEDFEEATRIKKLLDEKKKPKE